MASFIHSFALSTFCVDSLQVDGDTDSTAVQREFEKNVRQQIEKLSGGMTNFNKGDGGTDYRPNDEMTSYSSGSGGLFRPNGVTKSNMNDGYVEDLEEHHMPGAIPTISKQVSNHMSLANGHIGGNTTNSGKFPRNRALPPGATNGYVANGRSNFRSMLEDAEMNSHI